MVGRIEGITSSWQPNISEFGQQVAASLGDVREKIDAYDKSIGEYWGDSTLPWVARRVAGEIGHSYYSLPVNNALSDKIPGSLLKVAEKKLTYEEILGIENYKLLKTDNATWKEFLQNKNNWQLYKMAVSGNFENFLKAEQLKTLNPLAYLKRTVVGNNLHSLIEEISEGRIFPFTAKLLGFYALGSEVLSNTKQYYFNEKSKEDGSNWSRFKTLLKTGLCFTKETAKGIATWEIGNIGYKIGMGLVCVGILPGIISGCILGGLFSAAFRKLFD